MLLVVFVLAFSLMLNLSAATTGMTTDGGGTYGWASGSHSESYPTCFAETQIYTGGYYRTGSSMSMVYYASAYSMRYLDDGFTYLLYAHDGCLEETDHDYYQTASGTYYA